jgi:hypothetical protein
VGKQRPGGSGPCVDGPCPFRSPPRESRRRESRSARADCMRPASTGVRPGIRWCAPAPVPSAGAVGVQPREISLRPSLVEVGRPDFAVEPSGRRSPPLGGFRWQLPAAVSRSRGLSRSRTPCLAAPDFALARSSAAPWRRDHTTATSLGDAVPHYGRFVLNCVSSPTMWGAATEAPPNEGALAAEPGTEVAPAAGRDRAGIESEPEIRTGR